MQAEASDVITALQEQISTLSLQLATAFAAAKGLQRRVVELEKENGELCQQLWDATDPPGDE